MHAQTVSCLIMLLLGMGYSVLAKGVEEPMQSRPSREGMRRLEYIVDNNISVNKWWATLVAEYDPVQFMPEDTYPNLGRRGMNSEWWRVETHRIRKMGMQAVRMWFQLDWWEPFNDNMDPYSYDRSFKGFDTDGPRMESVYKFLDLCQQENIEVQLNFGWLLDWPARDWLAREPEQKDTSPDIGNVQEFVESLISLLDYLKNVKKYNVVTHISLGNEFNYNYVDIYKSLHDRMVKENIRDKYVLVGFESNKGIAESARYSMRNPGVLDVHSLHTYRTMDLQKEIKRAYGRLGHDGKYKINGFKEKLYFSEIPLGPSKGVDIALAVQSSAANGAYAIGGWRLADQHLASPIDNVDGKDRFDHGLHKWGTWQWIPWMLPLRESYYATSLLTRYTRKYSNIYSVYLTSVVPEGKVDKAPRITVFEKGGQYTILAVNKSKDDYGVRIEFKRPVKKRFFRHPFVTGKNKNNVRDTLVPSDKVFDDGVIRDKIVKNSFVLYTTIPDEPQLEIEPYLVSLKPGAGIQFKVRRIHYKGPLAWQVYPEEAGSISDQGYYRAPREYRGEEPIVIRAYRPGSRVVEGLALVMLSGERLRDPETRVSISLGRQNLIAISRKEQKLYDKLKKLRRKYTDKHPLVMSVKRQLEELKRTEGSEEERKNHSWIIRGARMVDFGKDVEVGATLSFDFELKAHGNKSVRYDVEASDPRAQIDAKSGIIQKGGKIKVKVRIATGGMEKGEWHKGRIFVRSGNKKDRDYLEYYFRTTAPETRERTHK